MSDDEEKNEYLGKGLASLGVCLAGTVCMCLTNGTTGIGWIVFGLVVIWC